MARAIAPAASVTEPGAPVVAEPVEPEVAEPAADLLSDSEPEAVEYVANVTIMGTRNGVPWPPAGESIAPMGLPEDEVAQYLALGYIRPAE